MKKETPILMCAEMVLATLQDRKTQTRRVVDIKQFGGPCETHESRGRFTCENGLWRSSAGDWNVWSDPKPCPYGGHGDRLIVKETHYLWGKWIRNGVTKTGKPAWKFKQSPWRGDGNGIRFDVAETRSFEKAADRTHLGWHKRPSIFMPVRGASLTLEITNVRVERVQSISYDDCVAEGCDDDGFANDRYRFLWDSLNAKRDKGIYSWKNNPYVWVVQFKRI